MPTTLLAVDDSATMRKVLEITFGGEDYRVITAEGRASALAKLDEGPRVVLIDSMLDRDDGYALAKEIRERNPAAALIMLCSRFHPYDTGRAREVGADDFMDKPFDTQAMLDKVRKVIQSREAGPAAARQASAPAFHPTPQVVPMPYSPATSAAPAATKPAGQPGMSPRHTVMGVAPPIATIHAAQVQVAAPAAASLQAAALGPVAAAVNGEVAGKIAALGLSPAQADAIVALSRELVERVVWEVVPQLAETLIREEIGRLMREG